MSYAVAGVLRMTSGTDRDALARKMVDAALKFGYGLLFEPGQSNDAWAAEAIEKLGGKDAALFFIAVSEPWDSNIDAALSDEMYEPLDWSKVKFPTFLLKLWQLPEIEAALIVRYNSDMHDLEREEGLPAPVSIYRVMHAVASEFRGPATQYYLDKSSLEPVCG